MTGGGSQNKSAPPAWIVDYAFRFFLRVRDNRPPYSWLISNYDIAIHYLRTNLMVDSISALPISLMLQLGNRRCSDVVDVFAYRSSLKATRWG